ncbi:MAG: FAD-binding oxidoreductase [Acidobacteria bacterium]|nr:FAD-binding oxidoreductase [Acidobacteriota bacterium]
MASNKKTFDAAIVGAGIVGAACAVALAREGLKVLILDSSSAASGTTAAGMGHIVAMDDSPAQLALTHYSQKLWRRLAPELPASCEYENCGTIWVAANADEMSEVHRKKAVYDENGITAHVLDAQALLDAEPNLAKHLSGGLLVDSDAVVYQLAATRYLLLKAVKQGAEYRQFNSVASLSDDGVGLPSGERISAGTTINAAGAHAGDLSPSLEIRPRKGHLVITDRYPGFVRHQLVELGYLKSAHGSDASSVAFNVQPRKTGQILLGSSRQFNSNDDAVDNAILNRMAARGFEYMPALKEMSAVRVWTGFRPATPDNLPYIGKVTGFKNIYAAAGHEGLGITMSLGTAELLADEIMGRESPIPRQPYSPGRSAASS